MIGESFGEEIDCGNFFDSIDDLLDFPTEDLDDVAFTSNAAFPPIWSTHSHSLPTAAADPVFSGNTDAALSAELSVPYEDIVQLEWLSNFVDDSFSGAETLTINNFSLSPSPTSSVPNQFHTSSPVSVLDSSSSSSCSETLAAGKRGRARSKRPRPPSFIPRPPPPVVSPTNSEATAGKVSSDSENYAESRSPPPPAKKAKKIKLSFRRDQNDALSSPQGVRKCLHCEVTKTPQWRAGPLGPKTLCNACGVRFKSGRLFPEYRPAASPTFVPCLHSNSHKKVLEMRTKQEENGAESTAEESPELIPNTNSGIVLGYA